MSLVTNQQPKLNKDDIILAFKDYVLSINGEKFWRLLVRRNAEGYELQYLINNYGISAFQDLVNEYSSLTGMKIADIISHFSNFYHTWK